jgi:hypothetical protein
MTIAYIVCTFLMLGADRRYMDQNRAIVNRVRALPPVIAHDKAGAALARVPDSIEEDIARWAKEFLSFKIMQLGFYMLILTGLTAWLARAMQSFGVSGSLVFRCSGVDAGFDGIPSLEDASYSCAASHGASIRLFLVAVYVMRASIVVRIILSCLAVREYRKTRRWARGRRVEIRDASAGTGSGAGAGAGAAGASARSIGGEVFGAGIMGAGISAGIAQGMGVDVNPADFDAAFAQGRAAVANLGIEV